MCTNGSERISTDLYEPALTCYSVPDIHSSVRQLLIGVIDCPYRFR